MAEVVVFGSVNIDIVYAVPHIVLSGETIASTALERHAGGKGANQTVAAQRAGAVVKLIGCIARDGLWIKKLLQEEGINTEDLFLLQEDTGTGNAIIQVASDSKDNAIVLYPGGNHRNEISHVGQALDKFNGNWIMFQNECNIIKEVMHKASERGLKIAFNPAPMSNSLINDFPLKLVSLLILNEGEAKSLSQQLKNKSDSVKDALDCISRFESDKLMGVVITLGGEGVVAKFKVEGQWQDIQVDAPKLTNIVDTTGAGDTFSGYLVASLAKQENMSIQTIKEALKLAVKAGSMACTKKGAIPSIPYITELQ